MFHGGLLYTYENFKSGLLICCDAVAEKDSLCQRMTAAWWPGPEHHVIQLTVLTATAGSGWNSYQRHSYADKSHLMRCNVGVVLG